MVRRGLARIARHPLPHAATWSDRSAAGWSWAWLRSSSCAGPGEIGKTTAYLQLVQDLLAEGVEPRRICRIQFDELSSLQGIEDPLPRLVGWYERTVLGETLNAAAQAGRPAYLFLDEVQNLTGWAPQLKHLADTSTVRIVVTGSSALRIEQGRDSLAGRLTTIEAGVMSLTEIAAVRGLGGIEPYLADNGTEPFTRLEFWRDLAAYGRTHAALRDAAFAAFSERGGYPLAHKAAMVPWADVADQLNEIVIRRVIQHDLRLGERGRNCLLLKSHEFWATLFSCRRGA